MSVPLSNIVDVKVEISKLATFTSNFNLGLIIGNSAVLTANNRVKVYAADSFKTEMVADGFTTASSEYMAASAYFAQNSNPSQVAIGVQLEDETPLQALAACMVSNEEVYGICFATEIQSADIQAIVADLASASSPCIFFYQTDDENCLQKNQQNIMATLQAGNYNNAVGFYSTQDYMDAAVLGLFCGLNTMQTNSAYTLAYKSLVGFNPEEVGSVGLAAIESYNGNVYCQFGGRYDFIVPGLASSGLHVDEVFMLDAIYSMIQQNVVAGLVNVKKIPQTDSGLAEIVSFVSAACQQLADIGFIGTGIWTGPPVLDLETGDAIPGGYKVQTGTFAEQSQQDRQNRISPPIYVAIKSSGAIEHIIVRVYVNQ